MNELIDEARKLLKEVNWIWVSNACWSVWAVQECKRIAKRAIAVRAKKKAMREAAEALEAEDAMKQ